DRFRRPQREALLVSDRARHRPGAARLGARRRRAQHAPPRRLPGGAEGRSSERRPHAHRAPRPRPARRHAGRSAAKRRVNRLPSDDHIAWRDVFGNTHPVELEIGPGRGDALLGFARAAPGTNFFAIERLPAAAEAIMQRASRHALTNVRVIGGDARCIVASLVADASVTAYHIYFPDPWPKTRHRRRRLATVEFGHSLRRTLLSGGMVHLASDLR